MRPYRTRQPDRLKLIDSPPTSPDTALDSPRQYPFQASDSTPGGPGSRNFPSSVKNIETTPPEPCPPFVFPSRPLPSPTNLTASFNRRPLSSHTPGDSLEVKRDSTSVLQNVKSVSTTHDADTGMASPPLSPTSSLAIPSRPGGHRRGGSEFIGGDGKAGGPGLMSTSPTKGDGILPPPSAPGLRPPTGRRGHAHRRSGAISCHDLSMILKPAEANVGYRSAPVSPCEPTARQDGLPLPDASGQLPAANLDSNVNNIPRDGFGRPLMSESEIGARRSRVGFSDTLEFIPRPLSALSSETSSTLTPVRGHSLSGSISSIASGSTSSPHSGRERGTSLSTAFEDESMQPRPSTAGAVLSIPSSSKRISFSDSIPPSKRPSSASASPSTSVGSPVTPRFPPKKKHQSDIYQSPSVSAPNVSTPATVTPTEHAENPEPQYLDSPPASPFSASTPQETVEQAQQGLDESRRNPEPKSGKKPKRVKSWIFSRKSKHRTRKQKLARRSPTPPPLPNYAQAPSSDFELSNNSDHTLANSMGSYYSGPQRAPNLDHSYPRIAGGPAPREPESMSPVIDLDAALGPFNTPSISPDFGSSSRGGFMSPKRRMHSSGRTGGFIGPGMHYHRRTESAPEMSPFDWGEFGIHRLASSSTMADVFEEDEENEEEDEGKVDAESRRTGAVEAEAEKEEEKEEGLGIGIQVVDTDNPRDGTGMDWTVEADRCLDRNTKEDSGSGEIEPREPNMVVRQEISIGSLANEVIPEESTTGPIEATNSSGPTCQSSSDTRSSESTVTPPLSSDQFDGTLGATIPRFPSHPVFFAPDTPSSAASSTFPSPAFAPSSFDMDCRFPTARSSFTDDPAFDALLLGGPGPELRMSVDDVPSLTSSSSTMTSGINYNSQFGHTFEGRAPAERSMSISSSQSSRSAARKRSSLASLSRLVGSSYGEKSKLSNELNAQAEVPDKQTKEKKERRWSRVMHFWKQNKVQQE
ncbi:hypothetical protein GP486_004823 [Trichoglossum hirsutum]|uniref:Cell wall proline rich protein n=1 Tax=Trichoglossum hirsutum TaxID=265104 RepID=A0A9P8LA72_9PEZI|nr:hypothetical protein GP486_004823 [Trichoglossum hirsutum]